MNLERFGRVCVVLGLLMGWLSLGRVTRVNGLPYAPWGLDSLTMNGFITITATLIFLVICLGFLVGRRQDVAAAGLVGLLAAGTQAMAWQSPGDLGANGGTMLPGAALLAWVIARQTARTAPEREHRGIEAACGIVAAGYFVAAASKVGTSGLAWASPGNIGLQIATQGSMVAEPFHSWRMAAASSAGLCATIGIGTLVLEGGALSFVVPRARLPHAALLAVMHVGIALLMGLHHYDWMFTALGWACVSEGQRRVTSSASTVSPGIDPNRPAAP